ncbi:MAG: AI-2E family transporter [Ruminococcaceae bacterium]|nr:AI-2E family transporter [Oscillospiraceae bacterium]
MLNKEVKKYLGLTVFAILVIGIYKSWNTEFIDTLLDLLAPLFIGIGLAYFLYFPSKKIEGLLNKIPFKPIRKISRLFSVLFVYSIIVLVFYILLRIFTPKLINSLTELISQAPSALETLLTKLDSVSFMGYKINKDNVITSITSTVSVDVILNYLNFDNIILYIERLISVSGVLIDIFIGIIISVYLIIDREDFFRLGNRILCCIFPDNIKNEIMKYLRKVNEFMIRYIYCRLIDAAIMFFVSYFALLIFDIPYPFVLAAIVSVFNIVPYIGSILSTIILIIVTLFTSGISQGILVGIVMFILQQIDGNVIAPFLIKDRLKLNPVLVLVAVILGGGFGGIVGIMLGVPLAAVIRLIANDLMRRHEIIAKYKARHNGNPPTAYFGMNTGTVQTNHSSQLCVKNENNQKTTV